MSLRHRLAPVGLVLAAFGCVSAHAGTFGPAGWTSTSCGPAPVAPAIDLKNVDAYNLSVEKANAYLKASRTHVDCLTQEANADLKAISQSANAAQKAAQEARDKILADVQTAGDKFK